MRSCKHRFVPGLLISLLLAVTTSVQAQTTIATLERGSLEQRLQALVRILRIAPAQRDPGMLPPIEREAQRMLVYYRESYPAVDEGQRERYSAYAQGLVRALSESKNPDVIPILIGYAGFGSDAMDGLAQFGDAAVPQVLRAAQGTRNDLGHVNGSVMVLALMLKTPASDGVPLSAESREEINAFASQLLDQRLTLGNAIAVADLALATNRLDLRQELERLATDTQEWIQRGLVDLGEIKSTQDTIRVLLQRRPLVAF